MIEKLITEKTKRMCDSCDKMCDIRFLYVMKAEHIIMLEQVCLACLCFLKWI